MCIIGPCTEIGEMLDKESPVVVACTMGGTMRPSSAMNEGKESRYLFHSSLFSILFSVCGLGLQM